MKEKIETWYDLKRVINALTGEQLGQPVDVWTEDLLGCIIVKEVDIAEDGYVSMDGKYIE